MSQFALKRLLVSIALVWVGVGGALLGRAIFRRDDGTASVAGEFCLTDQATANIDCASELPA